ncbi:AP2 domain-containing protein [Nitrospirales bacterium NOB]|nr:AP2 domain-containing protein [Nitrospira sp. NTP2]MDL1888433.1 AP2 domain-containing protein [Nitrospirales bacterium NOB]
MYAICRIDHEASSTHSWHVTVQRRGQIFSRHFSDGKHGGKRYALQAAKAYRDSLVKQHQPLSRKEFCLIRKRTNRSGVSGVTRHEVPGRTPTSPRHCFWLAQWPIGNGKAEQRKFSIKKYGEEGAYLRAVQTRSRALAALARIPFYNFSRSA